MACNQQPECKAPTLAGNPADSELTLYMRHLETKVKAWRDSVAQGSTVAYHPELLDTMFTAIPTDGKIGDSVLFASLGNMFKQEVQALSTANPQDMSNHYNLMVTACINCHRNFCPGPIKRIEKLRL